jgi:hypothetical protein
MPPEMLCCRRLCHEPATEFIDVRSARPLLLGGGGGIDRSVRHFGLCRAHYDDYLPRGDGYMDRRNATRLRVQCVPYAQECVVV